MINVSYRTVSTEEDGQRLDNFLTKILKGVPKSHIYRIIRSGEVRVNKKRAKVNCRIEEGDEIRIPPVRTSEPKSVFVGSNTEKKLLDSIIYEDKELLVINKPAGIAVHGGSGLSLGVIEALRKIRSDIPYLELVHRLDKDTSGCLVLAKKRSMLREIHRLLETKKVNKTYWAILTHPWSGKKAINVDVALKKNIMKSGERIVSVDKDGKSSKTYFRLVENYKDACWAEVKPLTGRTHQIRVHSAHINHVIVGDNKYGFSSDTMNDFKQNRRLYLHARKIQFNLGGKEYLFTAEIDNSFQQLIKLLGKRSENQ